MTVLTQEQRDAFWRDGYLHGRGGRNASPARCPQGRNRGLGGAEPGACCAVRPTDSGWSAALRHGRRTQRRETGVCGASTTLRIFPMPIARSCSTSRMVDMVADLIGPDVKFHHCKINLKLSGAKTEVNYHQDFAHTPHTNDDIVTALLFLDDVDQNNGCLTVVPGSHKGRSCRCSKGKRFTGGRCCRRGEEGLGAVAAVPRQAGAVCRCTRACCMARLPTERTSRVASTSASTRRPMPMPIARNPMPSLNEEPHRTRQGSALCPPEGRAHRTAQAAEDRRLSSRCWVRTPSRRPSERSVSGRCRTDGDGEVADLFADIRATVGVRVVNLVWRHLAPWTALCPGPGRQ